MKNFFKLTILKIISTIILLLIVFGGQIIYGRTAIITENGPEAPTPLISAMNYVGDIIVYPVTLITSILLPDFFWMSFLLFLLLLIIETYLIVCVANYIILIIANKTK